MSRQKMGYMNASPEGFLEKILLPLPGDKVSISLLEKTKLAALMKYCQEPASCQDLLCKYQSNCNSFQ